MRPATFAVRIVIVTVVAIGGSGCTDSDRGESRSSSSSSSTDAADAEGQPDSATTHNDPAATHPTWQDLCIYTPHQVNDALAYSGMEVSETSDGGTYEPVSCEYRDGGEDLSLEPYSLSVSKLAYGPHLGHTGDESAVSFGGSDRASAYADACNAAQAVALTKCVTTPSGDYVVADTFAWIFRDDAVVELFASGGRLGDAELVAGLERLSQDALALHN